MMVYNGVPLKAHQFATDNVQLSGNSLRNAARQLFGFLQEKNGRVEKGKRVVKRGKAGTDLGQSKHTANCISSAK